MKVIVQRSKEAYVKVKDDVVGHIDKGLVLLVGITHEDREEDAIYLADKIAHLRIFEDEQGKMNLSIKDEGGAILSISQFTLYGDCRKGRRPNFTQAARPDHALPIYDRLNQALRDHGLQVEVGMFGEMMDVTLTNWGPVTLLLESGSTMR